MPIPRYDIRFETARPSVRLVLTGDWVTYFDHERAMEDLASEGRRLSSPAGSAAEIDRADRVLMAAPTQPTVGLTHVAALCDEVERLRGTLTAVRKALL